MIISDTHLGRPRNGVGSAAALRPLWQGVDDLVINGDVADIYEHRSQAEGARQVLQLAELCEADGVRLTLVSGNHDPLLTDRRFLRLGAGQLFVTHGDALHPGIAPWAVDARRLRRLHDEMIAALEPGARERVESRLGAAQYAAHFGWESQAATRRRGWGTLRKLPAMATMIPRVLWFWYTLPRRAAEFADQFAPECRFFVFGHIHRAGVWQFGERVLINTGSFGFPGCPHAVVVESGAVTVHRVNRDGVGYHLAQRPRWSFAA